ncbi:hypothetical protein FIBSPDRAFT_153624 [Athelia psychrophila]|uniref:Uncharacterized protein n=1 Tax=Athelia psychrophila TaxID=1759441 RepID=A0A166BIG5_9AGAM|nr:hypothetical protein FIBSPDRAFT_153624 [Fibularhizoctonia sp. CBS 109695]
MMLQKALWFTLKGHRNALAMCNVHGLGRYRCCVGYIPKSNGYCIIGAKTPVSKFPFMIFFCFHRVLCYILHACLRHPSLAPTLKPSSHAGSRPSIRLVPDDVLCFLVARQVLEYSMQLLQGIAKYFRKLSELVYISLAIHRYLEREEHARRIASILVFDTLR